MSLSEHAAAIKAAIAAAELDGFKLETDVIFNAWDSTIVEGIELDLFGEDGWTNVFKDDWS